MAVRIRVVTDGRAGIENQALGLAEAVARLRPAEIEVVRVRWRPAFDWLPADLKHPAMLSAGHEALAQLWPDIWIGAGRASLPLSLAAKRAGKALVVQVQDPRLEPGRFDLVVAPAHDGLSGPNVISITGSPHRVTPERTAAAAEAMKARLSLLPRPRVAVLVGGRSRAFDLTPEHAARLGQRVAAAVGAAGGSVLVTFSRRTPDGAKSAFEAELKGLPNWVWDGTGENPLFAFLGTADHLLVTEDSANMAAEAASTGKPVHVMPMTRIGRAEKFERLHADLRARGAARPFSGELEPWSYAPLRETERAAEAVVSRLRAKR